MSDISLTHTAGADGTLSITVAGRLAIDTVSALHDLMKEQIPRASSVTLDVTALEEIDLCGIQLICSACHTAFGGNVRFNFAGALPSCVLKGVSEVGLQEHKVCKFNTEVICIWCGGNN